MYGCDSHLLESRGKCVEECQVSSDVPGAAEEEFLELGAFRVAATFVPAGLYGRQPTDPFAPPRT